MARRIAPIPSAWTPSRTARRPVISCSPRWKTIGVRIASQTNGATGNGRLKPSWRDRVPQAVWVSPNGDFFTMPRAGAIKMWWQPAPFSLCLNCGEFYSRRELEFAKLASLSSEARTSATTVLATSLLRRAAGMEGSRDKLLTFTDNRQDASLQSGHFNDFIHVSLLRCALHAALQRDNELTFDRVAEAVVAASGLTVRSVAKNPELDPVSPAAEDVMRVFVELTEYRIYEDLRRGWRVVQPNLENVGLLRVGYRGLETLCADNARWQFHPAIAALAATERERLVRAFLDQFRRKLAIAARCLQETNQQQIRRGVRNSTLTSSGGWTKPARNCARPIGLCAKAQSQRLAEGFSLGERSKLGRFLAGELGLDSAGYDTFLDSLIALLGRSGIPPAAGPGGRPPIFSTRCRLPALAFG